MGGRGVDRVVQEHSIVGAVGRRVFPFEILEPKLFPCRHQCLALARSQDVMDRKDVHITVADVNVLTCCRNMRVRWWIWLAYEGTQTAGRSINPKPMKCPAWPHGHACCWSRVVLATPTERSVFLRTYNRGDKACVCGGGGGVCGGGGSVRHHVAVSTHIPYISNEAHLQKIRRDDACGYSASASLHNFAERWCATSLFRRYSDGHLIPQAVVLIQREAGDFIARP